MTNGRNKLELDETEYSQANLVTPNLGLTPLKSNEIYLVVLQSTQLKILEHAYLSRGYILTVWAAESFHRHSIVSINRFKLLTGGMYSVNGAAENATDKNRCSISPTPYDEILRYLEDPL